LSERARPTPWSLPGGGHDACRGAASSPHRLDGPAGGPGACRLCLAIEPRGVAGRPLRRLCRIFILRAVFAAARAPPWGDGAWCRGPLVRGLDGPRALECCAHIAAVGPAGGSHRRTAIAPADRLWLCGA